MESENFKAFQVAHGGNMDPEDHDANLSGLSDYYDHEPSLEFDDSEVTQATGLVPLPPGLLDLTSSDGTKEEYFEKELASDPQYFSFCSEITGGLDFNIFSELNRSGLVEVVGGDAIGQRIIVVSACRIPPANIHNDDLLRYLMFTLEKYVEQDYNIVYFHYGLTDRNKPSFSWVWKAYKAFDRKYKKNLNALYLVHPTNIVRIVWQMLRPAISFKFGRKMIYVNYLHELQQYLNLKKVYIPQQVLEHDKLLLSKNPRAAEIARQIMERDNKSKPAQGEAGASGSLPPPPTQQFGVSLQFIKENNTEMVDSIPPIVRQCVEFLSQPDALETEGIFRRSANSGVVKELLACNRGDRISFSNDPHIAAVLLKIFLRELEEPLMTFELFKDISQFQTWAIPERTRKVQILVLVKLPLDNYKLLKYIIQFLWKVQDRSCLNKMTSSNLAAVLGPKLSWPPHGLMSPQSIASITAFTDFLLENQESIFI